MIKSLKPFRCPKCHYTRDCYQRPEQVIRCQKCGTLMEKI